MRKICIACKREFEGHFNALTCSLECRKARRRGVDAGVDALPTPMTTCVVCGKKFPANRNLVCCSKECLQEKRRARWRQYWVDHPEKMQAQIAKRKERIATDKEFARKLNKRKYENIQADPERAARTRASGRESYRRHADRIQAERRERLRALSDAELIEYIERMRRYNREFRRRRRSDPETLAEDQAYQREYHQRRNAERLAMEAAALNHAIASGESMPVTRPPCLYCGASLVGKHTRARICGSEDCVRAYHKDLQQRHRERKS